MNAPIVSLFKNNNPLDIFGGYGSADFEIAETPLYYEPEDFSFPLKSSKKVVYRTDTGAELGVHSQAYKPVPPKVMIDQTRAIILRSELNTDGIEETIQSSHSGSRTFVKYRLPNHTYETPDGDEASLSLLAITSVDSSWPFMISVAAMQAACLNLQVFVGGEVAVYKAKHTTGLDIEHGARTIVKALDTFENERELWAEMTQQKVSVRSAFLAFAKVANCYDKVAELMNDNPSASGTQLLDMFPRNSTAMNYLWSAYGNYMKRFGNTQWAVYNAMTDWSTHADVSKGSRDNISSIRYNRMETVRSVVKSDLLKAA